MELKCRVTGRFSRVLETDTDGETASEVLGVIGQARRDVYTIAAGRSGPVHEAVKDKGRGRLEVTFSGELDTVLYGYGPDEAAAKRELEGFLKGKLGDVDCSMEVENENGEE